MPKLIPDRGPRSAKLVIVGEAPGKREWEEGAPFVGPSGWLLDRWMRESGIDRGSVYFTNVVRYWPGEFAPKAVKVGLNDFKWLPREVVNAERAALIRRLAELDDPIVIVPTGNQALRALFGDDRRISDYRGSILSIRLDRPNGGGRVVKCIPTIHPAASFRRPALTRFCVADWKRIAADLSFRDLRIPARQTIISSDMEFEKFMGEAAARGAPTAIDIECSTRDGHLQCIAAAFDPSFGIVIPLELGRSSSGDPFLARCWEWASQLCGPIKTIQSQLCGSIEATDNGQSPICGANPEYGRIAKVLQNGLFDQFILKQRGGIELTDYLYDTLELDHMLYPNDGSDPQAAEDGGDDIKIPMHSLSVLASLYTRQPFYKGDARDGFKFGWNRLEDLWSYCALDAMVTIEIFHKLFALAKERNLI